MLTDAKIRPQFVSAFARPVSSVGDLHMILDQFRLNGRRALVTGGSRGLGFEMAKALGEAGAELVIASRDAEKLKEAQAALAKAAPRVEIVPADLETPAGATAMCQQVLEKFAPTDILIH